MANKDLHLLLRVKDAVPEMSKTAFARISVPTLVIGPRYDTMPVDDIRRMGALIPNSPVAICERGSHLAMYDGQEAYFRHLVQFILDIEAGRPL